MNFNVTWTFLLLFLENVFSLKILVVFPHEGQSHLWVFAPIIRQLASRGHDLTVLTRYSLSLKSDNYVEMILKGKFKGVHDFTLEMFDKTSVELSLGSAVVLSLMGSEACDSMFSDAQTQKLMASNQKFDLIIAEMFNSECFLAFVDQFQAPVIGVSSTTLMPWYTGTFGQPDNPSYIENNHKASMSMDFLGRVENFILKMWYDSIHFFQLKYNHYLIEKKLRRKISSFDDLMRNISLLFVNSHFTLHQAKPLVPGIVEVGGIHVGVAKKLPENIEKFINESKHGVIYFSLGSMIKGHTFPQEKKDAFLKAFARLPQRVLWKWENETMPGKPDNVMIQKWMPQFDILSHPNVKAFISHGGLLGTTEAVHCGVPMMVMPQYGDQYTNAKAVEANGGGVILYLKDATEEKVYNNLKTILDPEFRAKAKALSERFRDRPMSPMDTAIYWVEYVARHKGAPHMKTAAVDMPLYQYLLLDVLAFLGLILLVFSYISYKILSLVLRSVFSKKKVKQN
ncbi:UDP-glycosyltransferase UGT5-like isoform X8 [Harmonia axyridis]|uniref:UDP-glycosyltransferase UGT5-like isoform X8 n=1 Tax=Harmonia axyridis TaxID=115357 RepID=UPI001E278E2C|nr:UDP-glycosyltransferase UGT5-like isoform X8 [Harmonia axyridis]